MNIPRIVQEWWECMRKVEYETTSRLSMEANLEGTSTLASYTAFG